MFAYRAVFTVKQKILILSLALNFLALGYGAWRVLRRSMDPAHSADALYRTRTDLFNVLHMDSKLTVFLGDSHIAGGLWNELFPTLTTAERGIGGDGTRGVLARLEPIIAARPRRIVLMIGVNDIIGKRDVEAIATDHRKIVERIHGDLPATELLVCSVLPVNDELMGIRRNAGIGRLNDMIQQHCSTLGVRYVDVHDRMIDGAGQLDPRLTYDGIHLNGEGYLIWKTAMVPFMN